MKLDAETIKELRAEIERKRKVEIEAAVRAATVKANAKAEKANRALDDLWDALGESESEPVESKESDAKSVKQGGNLVNNFPVLEEIPNGIVKGGDNESGETSDKIAEPPKKELLPTEKWTAEVINDTKGLVITQQMVYDELCKRHPKIKERPESSVRSQISGILKKFKTKGMLEVHKESQGSYPTEYKKRTQATQVPLPVVSDNELSEV